MDFEDLTDEQRARARAARTAEDILALAREEGYELTDDELEAMYGGWRGSNCDDCRVPYGR